MRLSSALVHLLCVSPMLVDAVPFRYSGLLRPWRKLSGLVLRLTSDIPGPYAAGEAGSQSKTEADHISDKRLARYGDDIVLRFNISTADEAIALAQATNELLLDVWEFNNNWVDTRLAKHAVPWLLGLLPASLQGSHTPLMQGLDLAQAVLDSYPSSSPSTPSSLPGLKYNTLAPSLRASGTTNTNIFFQDYQPLSVLTPWMRLMTSLYPTHVRMITIGSSHEGRDIPALRVGVHPKNNAAPSSPRKTILVTGGAHAREWISTSTVTYLAYHLITSYGKTHQQSTPSSSSLIEAFDWVFIPTLNPDGYAYTWTTDRLWRKNRQPTNLRFCAGLDLDRAFPFHWDGATRGNPCSESYAGETSFEAVEARRFAAWAKNETEHNNVEFVGYLDLHSYSQQVLYPYSYSCAADPPGLENLEELALGLAKAMRLARHGHNYKAASACEGNVSLDGKGRTVLPRVEAGGGSALDWFYHEMRVNYAFQIKLRDTGNYGFLLPKENIVPTGEEALRAMLYFGRYLSGDVGVGVDREEEESDERSGSELEVEVGHDRPQEEGEVSGYKHAEEGLAGQEEIQWELKMRRRR